MIQDAHANVLGSLHDLVGSVDVLLGRGTLLSGVRFIQRRSLRQSPDQKRACRCSHAEQVAVVRKAGREVVRHLEVKVHRLMHALVLADVILSRDTLSGARLDDIQPGTRRTIDATVVDAQLIRLRMVGLEGEPTIEKSVFSAARADGFDLAGRRQALVCGIEAHVCVSQTVHDLLADGLQVHVVADAVGSRHEQDRERALERMQAAGAVISTVEAALFELLERAGTPEFKPVQRLIL